MPEEMHRELPAGADGSEGVEGAQAADGAVDVEDVVAAIQDARARRKTERRAKTTTYVVVACVVVLLAFTVLGSMLNVGDHLMAAHPALGWAFYAVIVALVVVGIVVPIVKVARRPIFSLYQLRDEKGRAKQRRCRMLVENLVENVDLSDEEIAQLEQCLRAGNEADDQLIEFFKGHIVPVMDAETRRSATAAFFISAVSRSPLISTVTMLSVCFDLVRAIVETCGFRPTNLALARLYLRVMLSALIIGGIEDSDLSDLLGQLMGGGAGARAGGIIIGATAEGLVSAFLVFRVGVLTRRWLTAEDGPARMTELRRASYREALSMMRERDFMDTVTAAMKKMGASVAHGVSSTVAGAAKSAADATKRIFTPEFWKS